MDDWRLLRQYRDEGSQAAFGRLVDRHIKMVYWTCRRDVQNDQSAEDATQAVFVLLAQKSASLQRNVSIAGWLFNTARLVSRNVRRTEARRLRYDQEAVKRMEFDTAQEAGWQQVEPWLNDGLSSLPVSDRNILLLRYFEGLSIREVAQTVGASESAAKMRVTRALERLRQYLVKEDVAVTSMALPALLTEHAAVSVPSTCRATVMQATQGISPTHALPPINPLLAKGLLIMSTTKIIAGAVAAVVLLAAICFVIVHRLHSANSNVIWHAAPAADSATQQAEQQIQAQLDEYVAALNSGNVQKVMSVVSPDINVKARRVTFTGNDGVPRPVMTRAENYSDLAANVSLYVAHHDPGIQQMTVESCTITGNTADVMVSMDFRGNSGHTDTNIKFVNSGGKWLVTERGPPPFHFYM